MSTRRDGMLLRHVFFGRLCLTDDENVLEFHPRMDDESPILSGLKTHRTAPNEPLFIIRLSCYFSQDSEQPAPEL